MQSDGWDVAFVCSGVYLNQRLAQENAKYVFAFDYEDASIKVSGRFSSWEIVPNGSGELLHFHTPIATGSALIKSTKTCYDLSGAVPLVQLQLTFIEGTSIGDVKNLVFDCIQVGTTAGDKNPGAVTVINPDVNNKAGLNAVAVDLLVPALARSFIANRDKLKFVFAFIDLMPPKGSSWLQLRSLAYAYQQSEKDTLGNFAVLGMLDNVDLSKHTRAFDAALLPSGDDFAFLLSGTQFLTHVILPSLPSAFKGSSVSQFRMSGSHINNNGRITMESVKVGAVRYHPYIDNFDMHIIGNYIQTNASGRCPISGLTDAYINFSLSEKAVATFHPDTGAITFTASDKHTTHSTHIPWWESFVGVFTLGIMNVVVEAVSLAIEDAVKGEVGSSGLNAASLGAFEVSWVPGRNAILTDGGLADNFYCRGKLSN